jgi:hypothetical protein
MMTFRVIVEHIAAEPFVPFRMHTAGGRAFDVRHPEFIRVGRTKVEVDCPPENDPDGPLHWEEFPLVLIESILPLDAPVASNGNRNK